MAHSDNYISKVTLPDGVTYEIHDEKAIHDVSDLNLSTVFKYKGSKDTTAEILALTNADVGDVWRSVENDTEYVCLVSVGSTANANAWEEFGPAHDTVSSGTFTEHTHGITVTGTNESSTISGSVSVPTVSATQKHLSASAGKPAVTPSTDTVLGTGTKFSTSGGAATVTKTKLSATASGTAVGANGTAAVITGFGSHTTATVPTAMTTTTVKNPTVTAVSIPNVTKNESVTASKVTATAVTASKISENTSVTATKVSSFGTAASWGASVSNGVLSFSWTPNTVGSGSTVTASKVTASDVTAHSVTTTDVAATKVTLGTALSASSVSTTDVTVATGAFKSTAKAITALGTPTTATALTGVKVTTQPNVTIVANADEGDVEVATDVSVSAVSVTASGDNVTALTGVTLGVPAITLTEADSSSTGSVPVVSAVSVGSKSASVSGTAAAQKWTQTGGVTGKPQ